MERKGFSTIFNDRILQAMCYFDTSASTPKILCPVDDIGNRRNKKYTKIIILVTQNNLNLTQHSCNSIHKDSKNFSLGIDQRTVFTRYWMTAKFTKSDPIMTFFSLRIKK